MYLTGLRDAYVCLFPEMVGKRMEVGGEGLHCMWMALVRLWLDGMKNRRTEAPQLHRGSVVTAILWSISWTADPPAFECWLTRDPPKSFQASASDWGSISSTCCSDASVLTEYLLVSPNSQNYLPSDHVNQLFKSRIHDIFFWLCLLEVSEWHR